MISSFTFKKSPNKTSSSNNTNTKNSKAVASSKLPKNLFSSLRSKRSVANNQSKEKKLILCIGGRPLHLQEIYAKGSTSNVWKVLDTTSKHDSCYALKAISLQSKEGNGNEEDFFEVEQRARLEIDALKKIQQENVITLLDHEWGGDDPFSTQLKDGECQERRYHRFCYLLTPLYPMNLREFVKKSQSGKITDKVLLQSIIQGVCKGLEAVHLAGFRHNDIRPENILMQPIASNRAHVVLADFGAVSPANVEVSSRFEADRQKQFHKLYSHPNYTAPELWLVLPRSWITPKTDAFSVGCTLYFLLLGKDPFADTRGVGRRLTFPKKHELDFFFYHLCLAFLLKSPQKRISINEAVSATFHMELMPTIHSLVYEEFHMFHGVKNVVSTQSVKYLNARGRKWKPNHSSNFLSSSAGDLEAVRECHFMTYLGDYDSDEDTTMTEDENVMNHKSLIRTIGCSLSY